MATFQEGVDHSQLEQERYMLADKQNLVAQLTIELKAIQSKEDAGRRILEEIAGLVANGHPEDVSASDERMAKAALLKLAGQRSVLETRIASAKSRIGALQANIARFDLPKIQRLEKIRGLFRQLAG